MVARAAPPHRQPPHCRHQPRGFPGYLHLAALRGGAFPQAGCAAQLCRLLAVKLRGVRGGFEVEEIAGQGWFKGATQADVERMVRRAVKEMVLEGGDLRLRVRHLESARRSDDSPWRVTGLRNRGREEWLIATGTRNFPKTARRETQRHPFLNRTSGSSG